MEKVAVETKIKNKFMKDLKVEVYKVSFYINLVDLTHGGLMTDYIKISSV